MKCFLILSNSVATALGEGLTLKPHPFTLSEDKFQGKGIVYYLYVAFKVLSMITNFFFHNLRQILQNHNDINLE